MKQYFGVMRLERFEDRLVTDQWFIHFSFESSYNGEEDCSQHDDDMWEAFWKLSAVNYEVICKKHFASPSNWNYIRLLKDTNIEDLHMEKWIQKSPFFRDGKWQQNR